MIRELQAIVTKLFENEEYQCRRTKDGDESCIMHEDKRPLTKTEKALGWVQRPFYGYQPDNMCCTCRAYWHAENARQAIERHELLKRMEEREKQKASV